MKSGNLVAPWLRSAGNARLVAAAMKLIDVRVIEICQADAILGKPGIERSCVPGLRSQADDGVLPPDQ